jgi:hypothetical protein
VSRIQRLDDETMSIQTTTLTPSEATNTKYHYEIVEENSKINISGNYYQESPVKMRSGIENKGINNKSRNFLDIEKGDEKTTIIKRLKINTRNEKVLISPRNNIDSYTLKSNYLLYNSTNNNTINGNKKSFSNKEANMFNITLSRRGTTPRNVLLTDPKTIVEEIQSNKAKTTKFSKFLQSKEKKRVRLNTEELMSKIANIKITNSPMLKKEKSAAAGVQFSKITMISPKLTASKVQFPAKFPDNFSLNPKPSPEKKPIFQPPMSTKNNKVVIKLVKETSERNKSKSVTMRK